MTIHRVVALTLLALNTCVTAEHPALQLEDVELLVQLEAAEAQMERLARERCLAFPLDSANSQKLVSAGANMKVIGMLAIAAAACSGARTAEAAPKPGAQANNPRDGLTYVLVPAGIFTMGCPVFDVECAADEKPRHVVRISSPFWMGRTEVPVYAYRKFAEQIGKPMPSGTTQLANRPVVNVSWHDAVAYCQWSGGRLPTEAEWEYAARGGTTLITYGALDEIAWFRVNSNGQPQATGQKRANAFGLHDMQGNVLEWVADWYLREYYGMSPTTDPKGPPSAVRTRVPGRPTEFPMGPTERVVRGGSYTNDANVLRLSARDKNRPERVFPNLGFRCVWSK